MISSPANATKIDTTFSLAAKQLSPQNNIPTRKLSFILEQPEHKTPKSKSVIEVADPVGFELYDISKETIDDQDLYTKFVKENIKIYKALYDRYSVRIQEKAVN